MRALLLIGALASACIDSAEAVGHGRRSFALAGPLTAELATLTSNEAILFGGTNEWISIADAATLEPAAAFTLLYRARPTAGAAARRYAAKWDSTAVQGGWISSMHATTPFTGVSMSLAVNASGSQFCNATTANGVVTLNTWGDHVWTYNGAGVDDDAKVDFEFDGAVQALAVTFGGGATACPSSIPDSTAGLGIGWFTGDSGTRAATSWIDEVCYCTRVATAQEKSDWRTKRQCPTDCPGWWRFETTDVSPDDDSTAGGTIYDRRDAVANNGTATNTEAGDLTTAP